MRRKNREMDAAFALQVVDKCAYATLACVSPDGMPYCMPLSIARSENKVYFHCATDGQRVDYITQNPNVCIACVGDVMPTTDSFSTEYESAILFGKAQLVTEYEEKIEALRIICERYVPTYMHAFDSEINRSIKRTAVYRVDVESITGKRKKLDATSKDIHGNMHN